MNCEQCRFGLFEFFEGSLSEDRRRDIDTHLQTCEACACALSDVWQMQMVATSWREARVPNWKPRRLFFDDRSWLSGLQLAGSFVSVVVLVLVLAGFRVSSDGVEFGFARNYVDASELAEEMNALRRDQRMVMESQLDRLTSQQVASNQLMLRTILESSREERREDIASVVALLDQQEAQRARETRESLRYLITSQMEDKRDIQRLNEALVQVSSDNRF